MYRRRQRRLLALALEREYLLESAEAELATGRPMRRETLYRLAGVDAEAASLGGGGGLEDAVRRKSAPDNNRGSRMRANSSGRSYSKSDDDFNDMGYGDSGYGDRYGGGGGGGGGYPEGFDMDARRGSAPVSPQYAQPRGRQAGRSHLQLLHNGLLYAHLKVCALCEPQILFSFLNAAANCSLPVKHKLGSTKWN